MGQQKIDKYAILNEMRQHLDQLAEAKGTLRCGLIWGMNNMIEAMNEVLQEEDKANEQKINDIWKVAQEGKETAEHAENRYSDPALQ